MDTAKQKFVSLETLAIELCLPKTYLKKLVDQKQIPCLNVNGRWRFSVQAVRHSLNGIANKGQNVPPYISNKINTPERNLNG